jgi:hypothetical protein
MQAYEKVLVSSICYGLKSKYVLTNFLNFNMEDQLPFYLKGRRPSEVFMEYVEPFLETLLLDRVQKGVLETPSLEEFESILRMPWSIWNAIVAEGVPGNKINILALMDNLIPAHIPDSTKNLLNYMKRRKKSDFGQYQYYLGKYKLYYDQNNEIRMRIETTLPNPFPESILAP